MIILGIESSCDDTAVAVVDITDDEHTVLSSVVNSQDDIHGEYGGIVPELASRRHIEDIVPVVEEALKRASTTLDQIEAVGVTQGPGLVGSILIGLSFAKSLAHSTGKPFVGVNHIEAHPLAVFLKDPAYNDEDKATPQFPFVALIVSGGHTSLMLYKDFTTCSILGQTRDDAVGEAFDKVAKLLGLGYPGGVHIDRLAKLGDIAKFKFKRTLIEKNNLEFSFSGIKTAVLTETKKLGDTPMTEEFKQDISASFQEAVVDVLIKKSLWAMEQTDCKELVIAGGVACNSRLREKSSDSAKENNFNIYIAPPRYCSDNGAMIAASAYHLLEEGLSGDLTMNAKPNSFNVKEQ